MCDAVPALENFGFRVLSEQPTELAGGHAGTIHDFRLGLLRGESAAPLLDQAEAIEAAIGAVLNARAEDDVFNRLIAGTGLAAREADWLRACYRYLRQTSVAVTISTVVDALRGAPAVTRALRSLFRVRHDPAFEGDRTAAVISAVMTTAPPPLATAAARAPAARRTPTPHLPNRVRGRRAPRKHKKAPR